MSATVLSYLEEEFQLSEQDFNVLQAIGSTDIEEELRYRKIGRNGLKQDLVKFSTEILSVCFHLLSLFQPE